jgi:hypothetical protein
VGGHLVSLQRVLHPFPTAWTALFVHGALEGVMPILIAVLAGLLAGRYLLGAEGRAGGRPRAVGGLLLLYWLPIAAVACFSIEPQPRYLLHVHPLGYVVVAAAVVALVDRAGSAVGPVTWRGGPGRHPPAWSSAVTVALVVLVLVHALTGLHELERNRIVDPNYVAALRYVAAGREAGQLVVVALPPPAYLVLEDRAELRFLAGPAGQPRADRYTRTADGVRVQDYWIGVEAITSVPALCDLLTQHPGAWIVVDRLRLRSGWAYAGPMAVVLGGATAEVFQEPGGALVLRPVPVGERSRRSREACAG